nr:sigma-70 family RNA polymerase sigma factor [Acidobacteriota bacterium]
MKNPSAGDDLIARVRDADVTALAELYDLHGARVYSLACRILRNPADAEDVVQEAFLQAWRQAASFDLARGSVAGWLLTITRSRAIDRLRRRRGRGQREESCEDLEQMVAGQHPAVDQALIAEE